MQSETCHPAIPSSSSTSAQVAGEGRIKSIDALRGFVVFTMIFVNDLAGAPSNVVPAWMRHFHGKSGMTFVDLVFPAFLFIVGMSIPFALGSRLNKGEPYWKTLGHVMLRAGSLLLIGILMVNETPDSEKMGWSGTLWSTLMYLSAILAFCTLGPSRKISAGAKENQPIIIATVILRTLGLVSLAYLAIVFRGEDGHRIISFAPFAIHTSWYGILGLIGWAYLIGSLVFVIFRNNRTALLGCAALLLCLYPAERSGAFDGFWLGKYVGIGGTLGALPSITVCGVLLATILTTPQTASASSRIRFTVWFIVGCCFGAFLLQGLYGINKNAATPSWCLYACAITAVLWIGFYYISDIRPCVLSKPWIIAGQNVLLAYLISEMAPSLIELLHLGNWYGGLSEHSLGFALGRSIGCAFVVLCATAGLNRLGFRLKL